MSYSCYVYTAERSESEFLREALLRMAMEKKTPVDVFESDFSDVTTETARYVSLSEDMLMDYTASVGYYKEEKYEEWNNGTKRYETKSRRVIDWSPYSGSYEDTFYAWAKYEGENDGTESLMPSAVATCKGDSVDSLDEEELEGEMPSSEDITALRKRIQEKAYMACYRKIPGDRQEKVKIDFRRTTEKKKIHIAPLHALHYTYQGKRYGSKAPSFGKYEERADRPDGTAVIKKELNQKTLMWGIGAVATALLSTVLSLLVRVTALVCLGFVASLATTVLFLVMRGRIHKRIDRQNAQSRTEGLQKALARLGLSPLTEKEIHTLTEV